VSVPAHAGSPCHARRIGVRRASRDQADVKPAAMVITPCGRDKIAIEPSFRYTMNAV
jgi:hypothetical protein